MIRATPLPEAARLTTVNNRPAIFIPVVLPHAIISESGEVIELRHERNMADARA